MKKQQFVGRLLSRNEQLNIQGGAADCTYYLGCFPLCGGEEWFEVPSKSGGATETCESVYGDGATGIWESVCVLDI
jgi:hypothetical protein